MKLEFEGVEGVFSWKWRLKQNEGDELCGICRIPFDGACPQCKIPGDECDILCGNCTHSFHRHCIGKWLATEQASGRCPMCRQEF